MRGNLGHGRHLGRDSTATVVRKESQRTDSATAGRHPIYERSHPRSECRDRPEAGHRHPGHRSYPARSATMKSTRAFTEAKARFPTSSSGMET